MYRNFTLSYPTIMLSDHINLPENNYSNIFNNSIDEDLDKLLNKLDVTLESIQNDLQPQNSIPNDFLNPLVTLSSPVMLNCLTDPTATINVHGAASHISVDTL